MKLFRYCIFVLCIISLAACDSKSTITISGKLTDCQQKVIYLSRVTVDGVIPMDSTELRRGKFSFKVKADDKELKELLKEPAFYQVSLSPYNAFTTIARAGEKLVVKAVADSLVQTYTIQGGHDAELMQQLDHQLKLYIDSVRFLETIEKFFPSDNDSLREQLEVTYMQKVDNHIRMLKNFIEQNMNSLAVIPAFYQFYGRRHFFDESKDLDFLKKIYQTLNAQYPNNESVQYLKQRIDLVEYQKVLLETKEK